MWLHVLINIQLAQALIAQGLLEAAQALLTPPLAAEVGTEAELKWQLACGMLALAHGDRQRAATLAEAVAAQAEATGLRVYGPPAQRLRAVTRNPPPPARLPQVVWLPG